MAKGESAEYKYDVFISYRHVRPDADIARSLHRLLETFPIPKSLRSSGWLGRSFLDREELTAGDLTDSIREGIGRSRYLISVCSRRTRFSPWCLKEIELFRSLHGDERILVLLLEGEPEEVFPEALKSLKRSKEGEERRRELLAADIRTKAVKSPDFCGYEKLSAPELSIFRKEALKLLRETEIYRLMAGMLGISYGDLRQRGRERKLRLLLSISGMVLGVSLIFLFCLWNLYRRSVLSERRARQQTAIMILNYADSALARGDRLSSLLIADRAMDYVSDSMEEIDYIHSLDYSILNRALLREPYSGLSLLKTGREGPFYAALEGGKKLLVIGEDNGMELWDIEGGFRERSCSAPFPLVSLAADSENGIVVSNSFDGELLLWDKELESCQRIGNTGEKYYTEMGLAGGGKFLLGFRSLSASPRLELWNIEGKRIVYTKELGEGKQLLQVLPSPDGSSLAFALSDSSVIEVGLKDLEERVLLEPEEGKSAAGRTMLYSEDGRYLYRCLEDSLSIVDRENPSEKKSVELSLRCRAIRGYGNYLYLLASAGSKILLFDRESMEETGFLIGKNARLSNFEINPENGDAVGVWEDRSAAFWSGIDYHSKENKITGEIREMQDADSVKLSFTRDGKYLIHSAADGSILLLDAVGSGKRRECRGRLLSQSRNRSYTLHTDGERLYLFHTGEGKLLRDWELPEEVNPEFNVFSLNSSATVMAVSDTLSANLSLVDIASGEVLSETESRKKSAGEGVMVTGIQFSKDGSSVFAAFSDGVVESYDGRTGEPNGFRRELESGIVSIVLSEEDDAIAVNTAEHRCRIFSLPDGEEGEELPGECYSLYREGGKRNALGITGNDIFRYTEGEEIHIVPTNNLRQGMGNEKLNSNSISPDRRYLITNTGGDTVMTDAKTGVYIRSFGRGDAERPVSGRAYFTEDGEKLIFDSGTESSSLERVFREEELSALSEKALRGRSLSDEELSKIGRSQ